MRKPQREPVYDAESHRRYMEARDRDINLSGVITPKGMFVIINGNLFPESEYRKSNPIPTPVNFIKYKGHCDSRQDFLK